MGGGACGTGLGGIWRGWGRCDLRGEDEVDVPPPEHADGQPRAARDGEREDHLHLAARLRMGDMRLRSPGSLCVRNAGVGAHMDVAGGGDAKRSGLVESRGRRSRAAPEARRGVRPTGLSLKSVLYGHAMTTVYRAKHHSQARKLKK